MQFQRKRSCSPFVALAILSLVACTSADAQDTTPAAKPKPASPAVSGPSKQQIKKRQEKWLAVRPHFTEYRKLRWKLLIEYRGKVRKLIAVTKRGVSFGSFVDELMGLDAAFKATGNRSDVERHIGRLFSKQVVNMSQLAEATQRLFNEYNAACAELDNELLIACRIDASINPASLKACEVDSSQFQQHLLAMQSRLTDELYDICKAHLTATAAGVGAGAIGASIGYELGKDQNGATWMSGLFAIAGEMAASNAAEKLTYEVLETRKKATAMVQQGTDAMLNSLAGSADHFRGFELGLITISRNHDGLMLNGIAGLLELDSKWLGKHLPE